MACRVTPMASANAPTLPNNAIASLFFMAQMVSMFTSQCQHAYQIGKYTYHMRKRIGERIKELRESRGWSQAQLARKIHVSRPTVTQWESGSTENVRGENLIALARVFGITIDELLTGEPPYHIAESSAHYESGTASKEEEALLAKYRHLNSDDRARVQKIIAALDAETQNGVADSSS